MDRDAGPAAAGPFPIRLSNFVGRVEELWDIREALDRHRLATLVGPGGAGKTRLAVEAARAWVGGQRWYVDLAPVDGDAAVEPALAVATGAPEGPGEDPLDAAVRRIGEATGLILVDNCDQVVDGCAKAVDVLLRSCPGLTVLATSREPLRVEGELVVRVPPLSLPPDADSLDGDAVRLFLDRSNLSWDTGPRDWSGIRQICERLDGMPLAIELAAARAAALSVPDILAGLDDRFRLLADGPRTADRRQRSLAASIHWSYRLLTDAEAMVLQRLAVFRSPFTAEAATVVVAGDGVDAADALPLLARLVEKSFVVVEERDDVSRYRLLDTIREYAAERLEVDPSDARATRDRHLRHLRDIAERMEPELRLQSPRRWLDQLEAELPDIRAAVSWAGEAGDADDALRLVGALSRFWWVSARADGGRTLERALAIDGGEPRWRARALTAASLEARARSDPRALEFSLDAVRLADDGGDPRVAARAHCQLGWIYLYMDLARARPHLDRALELARDAPDPSTEAAVLSALVITEIGGRLPVAKRAADEALAFTSRHDDRVETCTVRLWLATIAFAQGRFTDVEAHADDALSLADAMGSIVSAVYARAFLAQCAGMRGDEVTASGHLDAMDAIAGGSARPLLSGYAAAVRAVLFGAPGQIAKARASLARALPAVPPFRFGMYLALMSDILTDAALEAGDVAGARGHAAKASEFAEDADNRWARSRAYLAAARVHAHAGEFHAASQGLHLTLELAADNEDVLNTVDALDLLAWLAFQRRAPLDAARIASSAAAARTRTGYLRPLAGEARTKRLIQEFREQLSDASFDEAWAQGAALPLEDAVALARRGRGGRKRPSIGWDSLTPAERRVVGLVGEGLTNPQIAAKLFVSPDTVKGHVSAALRKVGVSNRAELAAEAARRGEGPESSS